jgi:arylsulfatase A-like enzyme
MRRRFLFGVALCLSLFWGACGRGGDEAWRRFDLITERPARVTGGRLARRDLPLGPVEVRDAELMREVGRRPEGRLSAAAVHALVTAAGTRAQWRLSLGASPYLSFTPLPVPARPCPCAYRIEVRGEAGRPAVLRRVAAESSTAAAPAAVYVDLADWADQTVDLALALEGPAGTAAAWGSPAVYSRGSRGAAAVRRPPSGTPGKPNVLLLGLDTFRADALGAYGRVPSVTPALDRLAAESDVWLDAFSCFNVTNPSFASLLTGLYGKHHGIYDFDTRLAADRTTLAEALSGLGYDTRAILSIDHLADSRSGLGQGFDGVQVPGDQFAAELAVDAAMDWIGGRERPFFLWLHLFDAHTPHTPPQPFASGFRPETAVGLAPPRSWLAFRSPGPRAYRNVVLGGSADLYAGEVAYLDFQVGRLLDFLASRRLLDDTLVVLIADHGENLEEHGVSYRHAGLWDTTTHVPLMIRWPGGKREGRRIPGLVQNVDVFPTVLAAVGAPPLPGIDGIDLRRLTGDGTGDGKAGRRVVFAEHTGRLGAMVRTRRFKYMLSQGNRFVPDGAYLYDLEHDPREEANLAGQGLRAETELAALLRRWLADRKVAPGPRPQDEEELARLRALGYL